MKTKEISKQMKQEDASGKRVAWRLLENLSHTDTHHMVPGRVYRALYAVAKDTEIPATEKVNRSVWRSLFAHSSSLDRLERVSLQFLSASNVGHSLGAKQEVARRTVQQAAKRTRFETELSWLIGKNFAEKVTRKI
jgi:hypothetical protein